MYTAEANPEITEKLKDDPYPKFRFVPHFGEQLYTRKRPTLFIFCWKTGNPSITALSLDQPPSIPVLFGQAIFVSETRLYATGYEQTGDGRLLGVKGCFNRPTNIWEIILPSDSPETTTTTCKSVKIENPGCASRSPRVLLDQKCIPTTLFWLSNPVGGAHASTVTLHARDLKGTTGDRVLVGAVHDPSAEAFPGLYTEWNLADSPFLRLGDKAYVLVQSLWRARPTLISIDTETGTIIDSTPVLNDRALHSWNLLGTDGAHSVICSRGTPASPPETVLLTLAQDRSVENIQVLDKPAISSKRAYDTLKNS